MPVGVAERVEAGSAASAVTVTCLAKLPGCRLWEDASDLAEVALTGEQAALVGMGRSGPGPQVNSGGPLSSLQATHPPPNVRPIPEHEM